MDQHAATVPDFSFDEVDLTDNALPSVEEIVGASPTVDEKDSERQSRGIFAAVSVAAGLIVGVGGDLMFAQHDIGLSFLLFIGLSVVAVLATARLTRTGINTRNLWIIVPMLFFAGMVAVRTDLNMLFINLVMTLYLGGIGLFYIANPARIDEDTIGEHNTAAISAGFWSLIAPFVTVPAALGFLRGSLRSREKSRTWMAVARGLMIAVPLALMFIILFISADAVFARLMRTLMESMNLGSFSALVEHGFWIGTFGWVAAGGIAYGLARHLFGAQSMSAQAASSPQAKPKKHPFTLGMIESVIVLGMIDLLFLAFVVIQFAYFFGGVDTLTAGGLSYAEYARRGFFELMAVSGLTLGLVLWLDFVTVRSDSRQKTLFRALSTVLVALTGVILVSAANRMLLYEEAFGFTHLRVFVHVTIYWMGALFGAFLLSLYRVREHIFSLGTLVVIIGIAATLNLMNVDSYIAERNIARFENGAALDLAYLNTFSYDAVPQILAFYDRLNERGDETLVDVNFPYTVREAVGQQLVRDLMTLENERDTTIFAYNTSREQAYTLLDAARDRLPEFDPNYYTPYTATDVYGIGLRD